MYKKSINKCSKYIIISFVIISAFVLGGCSENLQIKETSPSLETPDIKPINISPEEAKEVISNETDIVILDVRTLEEYNTGYIKNSVLIPIDELENKASSVLSDKNQKILVYCGSGNRSRKASILLVDLGYTNVFDFGGLDSWNGEIVK